MRYSSLDVSITTQDMTHMQTQEADGSVLRIFIMKKGQAKGQIEGRQRFVGQSRVKHGTDQQAGSGSVQAERS
jgi:hypothetical protein